MMPSVTMLATCWFAEPVTDRLATEQPDSNGSGTAPPRRGVIGFFVHHRLAANLVMLVMLLGGTLALTRMNVQFFPTFALDVVSVRVVWSGASAEDIEQGITNPLEQRLRSVQGLKKMTSTSAQSVLSITLELRAVEQARSPEQFGQIPLLSGDRIQLRLGDIASIRQESRDSPLTLTRNDFPAVELQLQRSENGDSLEAADALQQWLAETRATLLLFLK